MEGGAPIKKIRHVWGILYNCPVNGRRSMMPMNSIYEDLWGFHGTCVMCHEEHQIDFAEGVRIAEEKQQKIREELLKDARSAGG